MAAKMVLLLKTNVCSSGLVTQNGG